jgi:hypothetical protein
MYSSVELMHTLRVAGVEAPQGGGELVRGGAVGESG